jgi:ribonuclease HI
MDDRTTVWIAGSCYPNPGLMGIGVVIHHPGHEPITVSEPCGSGTSPLAEYEALIRAFQLCRDLGASVFTIHSHNQVLVKQMRGEYAVHDPAIEDRYREVKRLAETFTLCRIVQVRSGENKEAHKLAKRAAIGGEAHRQEAVA